MRGEYHVVDVVLVLEKLQEINLIRLHKITGNYYTIYCPFHNGGQERRPSFGVSLHEEYRNRRKYPAGFAHCFTCGYAKVLPEFISDLLKANSITQTGVEWLQANIPGFLPDYEHELLVPDNLMSALNDKFAVDYMMSLQKKSQVYISEDELKQYRFTVPYMYERKLTDDVIAQYDVGFDANWVPEGRKKAIPCLTFPIRDRNGNVLFIYRRSIQGKFFAAPEGSEKPVYGIDMIPKGCRSLCICESIINALTAVSYGFCAVALLGTGTPYQIQQIKELGIHDLVLCMDGDDAGHKATARLKRQLSQTAMIWTVHMPNGKDLNDCSKEEFIELYNNRD